MKIVLIEADEAKIRELEQVSAMTWEGMYLDQENLDGIAALFIQKQLVKAETDEITGYAWYGHTMNSLYDLHGENRYPDNLPFLSFENDSFNGEGNLTVFKLEYGARWLDDIVGNNRLNEEEMKL